MTRFLSLALIVAISASPALSQDRSAIGPGDTRDVASRGAAAEDDGGHTPGHAAASPRGRYTLTFLDRPGGNPVAMGVDEASTQADIICDGDSILIFDYHEDGSVDETSYDFDCMSDL